jgi:hypothetical protein
VRVWKCRTCKGARRGSQGGNGARVRPNHDDRYVGGVRGRVGHTRVMFCSLDDEYFDNT